MAKLGERLSHAWNAFNGGNEDEKNVPGVSYVSYSPAPPDRIRLSVNNERSIISSIYTRLCVDVASIDIRHVRLDKDNRYYEDIDSWLNNCLTVEANIDQAATALKLDIAMTLFDKGVAAIVPVVTSLNPNVTGGYDIQNMRVGEVKQWYPKHVKLSVYNEEKGKRQDIILPKTMVAIVYNPFYAVMNETNSTLQRLIRKINLLDQVDEQSASGKLDLIIQLPYAIKSEARRQQADHRRQDIEFQLRGNKYGIAYTDGAEKITQLNRPVDNNLLNTIESLTKLLYSQLGVTEAIMDGTADEKTMINYTNRTVAPVLDAITEAMKRTFLTKTARTQKQSIMYFRDPFKLVPISQIADIADKFARNEITSSNEIRQAIGMKPSKDPKADQLVNSNMPAPAPSGPDPTLDPYAGQPTDPALDPSLQPTQ